MDEKDYLGTGIKFPIQIDPATGRIMTVSAEQSVKESVYLILTTKRGERLARPGFGSLTDSFVFMDVNLASVSMLKRELAMTILDQEPRISDVDIDVEHQSLEGRLIINIRYTLAGSNTTDNLVFPFYLEDSGAEFDETDDEFVDELFGADESDELNE